MSGFENQPQKIDSVDYALFIGFGLSGLSSLTPFWCLELLCFATFFAANKMENR